MLKRKSWGKTAVLIALIIAASIGGLLVWFFVSNRSHSGIAEADDLTKKANKHYKASSSDFEGVRQGVDGLYSINDEISQEELQSIANKAEELKAEIEKEISDIQKSTKLLREAKNLKTPRWYEDYIYNLTLRNNELVSAYLETKEGVQVLEKEIEHFSEISSAFSEIFFSLNKLNDVYSAIENQQYDQAMDMLNEIEESLARSSTTLSGLSEVIGTGFIDDTLVVISDFQKFTSIVKNYSRAKQSRNEVLADETAEEVREHANIVKQLIKDTGLENGIEGWFKKQNEFYSEQAEEKFLKSVLSDIEAEKLHATHK